MLRQTTQRGIDLKLFGAMFLLVGLIDMLIIEGFPAYALKLFGVTIAGPLAYLVKLHSPAAHFLIGYGFVFLRPWAWGLAMAYGGFGLMSERVWPSMILILQRNHVRKQTIYLVFTRISHDKRLRFKHVQRKTILLLMRKRHDIRRQASWKLKPRLRFKRIRNQGRLLIPMLRLNPHTRQPVPKNLHTQYKAT
jgi:hypothetical protein